MANQPSREAVGHDTTNPDRSEPSVAITTSRNEPSSLDTSFSGISEIAGVAPLAEVPDPLLGRTIGEVEIVGIIAEGGMGRIYEGRQRSPSRSVAVKVLRPGFMTAEGIRRFAREAEILGGLHHPHIAQVFWAGSCDVFGTPVPYIVMEFVDRGLPITAYAEHHQLPLSERVRLFRAACEALGQAHAMGIVHRDVKPSNMLVTATGEPKLIDFGIARIADSSAAGTALTEFGRLIGTVQYMSPEQLSGDSLLPDPRMDVYALGLVLHELVAGRRPYDIDSRRVFDAARVIRERKTVSLRDSPGREAPEWLEGVIEKCLSWEPENRFRTAHELAEALSGITQVTMPIRASGPSSTLARTSYTRSLIAAIPLTAVILVAVYVMPANPRTVFTWFRGTQASVESVPVLSPAGPVANIDEEDEVDDPLASIKQEPAEIFQSKDAFRFSFRDIHQQAADTFLVEKAGMKKWLEIASGGPKGVTYWGPTKQKAQGTLVYRFDLGGTSTRIHLQARVHCLPYGGMGAIDVSRDGENWITMADTIEPRQPGELVTVHGDLPGSALGTTSLWIRIRCLSEDSSLEDAYRRSQFARSHIGQTEPVFAVTVEIKGNEKR